MEVGEQRLQFSTAIYTFDGSVMAFDGASNHAHVTSLRRSVSVIARVGATQSRNGRGDGSGGCHGYRG